jgi:hypothetical protein
MKTNLSNLIVFAVLIAVIILQRECSSSDCPPCTVKTDTIRIVDTVWVPLKIEKKSKPKLKKSHSSDSIPEAYKPVDTTCVALKEKYTELVKKITTQNIYEDSIHVDSLGYIMITDTVQHNELQNRRAVANFKIPYIKENVYITKRIVEPPVRQLYVGGGISTSRYLNYATAEAGVLFKNKRDQIYGAQVGVTGNGLLVFGFQTYWKISLKK